MKSQLYDLDVPDEQMELELEGASRDEIICRTYEEWFSLPIDYLEAGEPAYKSACNMIRPFRDRISGTVDMDGFPFMKDTPENRFKFLENCGYYFSALLNETNADVLHVNKGPVKDANTKEIYINGLGYCLKEGKAVVVGKELSTGKPKDEDYFYYSGKSRLANTSHLGQNAQGGVIINMGKKCGMLGYKATGGVFLNYGFVDTAAHSAQGGLWLNCSEGEMGGFGNQSTGAVLISKGKAGGDTHVFDTVEMETDTNFTVMVGILEQLGREADIPKIRAQARELDQYVRTNYARQLA